MGSLANMCDSSFRFLNALFRIFDNQLVLHNKSDSTPPSSLMESLSPFNGTIDDGRPILSSVHDKKRAWIPRKDASTSEQTCAASWTVCDCSTSVGSIGTISCLPPSLALARSTHTM